MKEAWKVDKTKPKVREIIIYGVRKYKNILKKKKNRARSKNLFNPAFLIDDLEFISSYYDEKWMNK